MHLSPGTLVIPTDKWEVGEIATFSKLTMIRRYNDNPSYLMLDGVGSKRGFDVLFVVAAHPPDEEHSEFVYAVTPVSIGWICSHWNGSELLKDTT